MSLNWNVTKIADSDNVCFETAQHDIPTRGVVKGKRYLHHVTETLIWATIAVGLRGITEANKRTFWARISAYEKLYGTFLNDHEGKPLPITIDDIERHVGLSTNVSDETDAKWAKRIITDNWNRDRAYDFTRLAQSKQEVA